MVSTDTSNLIQADTAYQLLADLSIEASSGYLMTDATFTMKLKDGTTGLDLCQTVIDGTSMLNPIQGTFHTFSTGLTLPNPSLIGHSMKAAFYFNTPANPTTYYSCIVDNVRINSIPEPGTVVLLGIGSLGLLAYAWRKRR